MSILSDELKTGPLASEIAPYLINASVVDIFNITAILNTVNIVVPGNLSVHDVKQYLSLLDLRIALLDSTAIPCRVLNMALEDFTISGFDLSNPIIAGKISTTLDAVVTEPTIPQFTSAEKVQLLALGNKQISRAQQLGINITEHDVLTTIYADNGTRIV